MNIVRITLTGTKPIMLHNVRLANPLDPHTRALKALTSKRKKTDEDLSAVMFTEARAAAYETPEGYIGLPDANVLAAIQDAAKSFKRGKDVSRAVICDPVRVAPITFAGGSYEEVEAYLTSDPSHIDYRPVVVMRAKVMRSRPIIAEWSTVHDLEVETDIIEIEDLEQFVTHAGRLYGVGDHRPQYGRFTATVREV